MRQFDSTFKAMMRRRRTMAAGIALLVVCFAYWRCLPRPLFASPVSNVALSRNGDLLGAKIAEDGQWRFPPISAAPDKFSQALVAFEDKRFFHHFGFDPFALVRSARRNLRQRKTVSGGSTITMQVIRMARRNPERTYLEKLIELILATRLEWTASKADILALYSNNAPFGGNVVGIEAAAWRYFGRPPSSLSWAESCLLAVLPNSPALIHPGRNRDALKAKRDRLLHKLRDNGVLTPLDLDLALREPLPDEPLPLPQAAPHLLSTLMQDAANSRRRFDTTLDAALQRTVSDIISRRTSALRNQEIHNAAAIVVDNRSFEVLAYVGNSEWSVDNEMGYAVDIVRRARSTGSLLKPLLFAAMLEAGEILPTTLIPDVPTQYAGFAPENFDLVYHGAVPAQNALAQSLNVPAVRMLRSYGVRRFYDFLQNMGMSTLSRRADDYGLTLVLGGAEGTLWDLAGMYANLADIARQSGARPQSYRQLRVVRESRDAETTPARADIGPGAAWLTLNALLEVVRPGDEGYWRNFESSRKIAWKTGTSFGLRDAWAIGDTNRYTVAVWIGNANGQGRPGLMGGAVAAPVLFEIFNRLPDSDWFAQPFADMRQVDVCRNDGYLANGECDAERVWIPKDSHFEQVSPYNHLVHLDPAKRYRVHGECESPARMQHAQWFVLPADQEFYYRKHHPEYQALPEYRKDCRRPADAATSNGPIDFLYPRFATRLYIPVDLGEKKGRTVFEAVHPDADATLFWHLDDRYIGATTAFHQQALDITPGMHVVTVVDQDGNRLARRFEVLGKN